MPLPTSLPAGHASLAYGVPVSAPGTIFVLGLSGGTVEPPGDGHTVLFGRNREDVQVCVGEDDTKVSRRQGVLSHHHRQWWVHNTGKLPIRLPGSRLLFAAEEPVPFQPGYTPMFIRGTSRREHLLEVYVTDDERRGPVARHRDPTQLPRQWRLDDDEKLALVVLGQRYLLHEARPQPLSWRQAADQLHELQPAAGWTQKKVEHTVVAVRNLLSRNGVPGLTRDEVGEPVGNALNDNLLTELLLSTTLVPPDLALLD